MLLTAELLQKQKRKEAVYKVRSWWDWLSGTAASVSLVIIVLITAFESGMYLDFGVYEKAYEKYDVLSELDMEMEDVMHVTHEMMSYLRGGKEELSVITTVEGTEQDFFNEQDRLHMKDVQGLFIGGLCLRAGAVIMFLLCMAVLFARKADWKYILPRSCQAVLLVFGVLAAALGIAAATDFNRVFIMFHEIFFTNDLWIFDPSEDYMIRMLPEGLFFDMVIRIGIIFISILLVLLAISIILSKKAKKKQINNTYQ